MNSRAFVTAAVAVLLSGALLAVAHAQASPQTGRPAPAFVLPDGTDREVTLRSFTGRPLVINLFASWCAPCRQELPQIVAAARANRGSVSFLGVDEQEPRTMALAFVHEMKLPYPIVFDHGQFAASYGAQALPDTAFIDARGRLVAVFHGVMSPRELANDLAKIRAPKATPART
jgi:cytochrome c biogenesis protein CcmG/thiol:disulfide interchange protein DsbE